MKWGIFFAVAVGLLLLETSALGTLEIRLSGVGGIRPSFLMILGLYVSLWAPRMTALWACFVLGLMVDLTSPIAFAADKQAIEDASLAGPGALAYTFAGFVVLQVRSMVMRRHVFAAALLAVVFAIAVAVAVVAVYTIRSFLPWANEFPTFSPAAELGRRLLVALYTGVAAVPLGWLLLRTSRLWHFQTLASGSANWR